MTYDPDFTTNRDALFSVLPPWLRNFWGARLLYAITIQVDALEEMAKQAVLARFPGFNSSAIPDLCRARAIIRGPHETEAQITQRLVEWLEIHRLDGHPVGILQQLLAYFSPWSLHMRVVFANGNYFDSNGGEITIGNQSWNWDSLDLPCRFWVLIWPPAGVWVDDGDFAADGDAGDGGVLGIGPVTDTLSGTVYNSVQAIAGLIRGASSANMRHAGTIVIFDDAAWSAQQPDGTWNIMSHRNPNAAYLAGDRIYQ